MEVEENKTSSNILYLFGNQARNQSTQGTIVCVLVCMLLFCNILDTSKSFQNIFDDFMKLFPGQLQHRSDNYVIQKYDNDWHAFIDCNEDSDIKITNIMKLKLVQKSFHVPRVGNLQCNTTVFLCCDMQERFRPAICYFNEITAIANRLIQAAGLLNIPLIVSEQYPKGLLHTVPELDISKAKAVVPKTKFSMAIPPVLDAIKESVNKLESVVLFGVEAHVCIQQTALDFISQGIEVHIAADACSSRTQLDRTLAYQRLRQQGAVITTTESILLQLVGDKDHPCFKKVQALIKELAPDTGLFNIKSNI